VETTWYLVDARGKTLGRLASAVAQILRGKGKPQFTPHVDTGDSVVVVNAGDVVLTGGKARQRYRYRFSGYPAGIHRTRFDEILSQRPEELVRHAVKGMLPKTTLGRHLLGKLHVYRGGEHPHQAQKPQPLDLPG
jgi:large subunit ribosomal protein L13